jgi:hypothetical protein
MNFSSTVHGLGGQCHEMVVEMSPWRSSLGLNYGLRTLFSMKKLAAFKLRSIDVKSGFSNLADFATTRSPIDCELPKLFQGSGSEQKDLNLTGLGSVSLSRIQAHHTYISAIYHRKNWSLFFTVASRPPFSMICQNSALNGARKMKCYKIVAVWAKNKITSVGSSCNGCATIGRLQPSQHMPREKSELEAKSYQCLLDLENRFLHWWVCSLDLRQTIFKRKKG